MIKKPSILLGFFDGMKYENFYKRFQSLRVVSTSLLVFAKSFIISKNGLYFASNSISLASKGLNPAFLSHK
jgi:hypothetical protein